MVRCIVTHDAKIKLCQLWVTHCFSQIRLNSSIARRIVERFQNAVQTANLTSDTVTNIVSDDELICGLILVMEFGVSETFVIECLLEQKAVSELHQRLDIRGELKQFISQAQALIVTKDGQQTIH